MSQIKTKIENKNITWSARMRFRVGESCEHNDKTWANTTGANSEPGVGNDWVLTRGNQNAVGTGEIEIIDTLTSTSTTAGLAANQGRVLKGFIDTINDLLSSDDVSLDELQEVVNYIKANRDDLANLSIPNIAGLVDALEAKVDLRLSNIVSDLSEVEKTAIKNKLGVTEGLTGGEILYNVKNYGAKGDGKDVLDGNTTTGSNVFTSGIGPFQASDVGKVLCIKGFTTTISGFTDANTVTLTDNAPSTIAGASWCFGTDDTVAIQNTINTAFAAVGGKVYHPNSLYIINGALRTDVNGINYNSQLIIPQSNLYDADRPAIELVGEVQPNLFQALGIGNYTVPNSGAILRSTIQGSGVEPSVIANKGAATNFNGISYTSLQVKNISIQVTPNANSKVTMGGINCADSAIANFEYVTAYPHNQDLVLSGEPNVINVTGISMPKIATEHINTIDKCTVGGFTNGYKVGEHSYVPNAVAVACLNGFLVTENHHTPVLDKIECNWCKYDIAIDTATKVYNSSGYYVKVNDMLTEWKNQGVWYDNVATLNDPLNRGMGTICIDTVEANVGLNQERIKKINGDNIKCSPISVSTVNKQSGTAYTFKFVDAFHTNILTNAAAIVATIPNSSTITYNIGDVLTAKQGGAGQVSFVGASGVTLNTSETLKTRKQNSYISAEYEGNNIWSITGDLELSV